jgi:hypothetical protein
VAGLAAWQRSGAIADLADRVARGETGEATAAVRQLGAMPNPPLAILVEASASNERTIADAAQAAINRLLGKWQKQVDSNQHINSVASKVTELASALAAQRKEYPTGNQSLNIARSPLRMPRPRVNSTAGNIKPRLRRPTSL